MFKYRVMYSSIKDQSFENCLLDNSVAASFGLSERAFFKDTFRVLRPLVTHWGFTLLKPSILSAICKALAISRPPQTKFSFGRQLAQTITAPFLASLKLGDRLRSQDLECEYIIRFGSILSSQNKTVWLIAAPSCLSRQYAHSKINWARDARHPHLL